MDRIKVRAELEDGLLRVVVIGHRDTGKDDHVAATVQVTLSPEDSATLGSLLEDLAAANAGGVSSLLTVAAAEAIVARHRQRKAA